MSVLFYGLDISISPEKQYIPTRHHLPGFRLIYIYWYFKVLVFTVNAYELWIIRLILQTQETISAHWGKIPGIHFHQRQCEQLFWLLMQTASCWNPAKGYVQIDILLFFYTWHKIFKWEIISVWNQITEKNRFYKFTAVPSLMRSSVSQNSGQRVCYKQ